MAKNLFWPLLFFVFLLSFYNPAMADQEPDAKATQILHHQLEALKANNMSMFKKYGNKAFKELFTEFDFESLYLNTKSRLSREYDIKYLDSIRRVGSMEYLWKFKNRDVKKEHLIRMTLTRNGEYMVGFDFD
jgi:hypothetical protein